MAEAQTVIEERGNSQQLLQLPGRRWQLHFPTRSARLWRWVVTFRIRGVNELVTTDVKVCGGSSSTSSIISCRTKRHRAKRDRAALTHMHFQLHCKSTITT
jgi:hypothetical protein